jgi:cytochrome c-type biogenesis protein
VDLLLELAAPLAQSGVGERASDAIWNANLLVAGAIAFVAGLVSFASPCVVPLVPGYLSFMTGLSGEELASSGARARGRVFLGSVLFVAGFAIPFVMLGSFVAASTFLATTTWVQQVLGVVVIALGLLMASGRLMREFRFMHRAPDAGLAGAPILGFVFGVGWTPCIGPAAGAILTLAGSVSGGVSYRGAILGFLYAFGLGVPFILFGLLFNRTAGALAFLRRNARSLQLVGGGVLVLVGIALVTGLWDLFIRWLRPMISGFTPPI